MQSDAISGAILGCAVGDALGLPYEGLSKRRGVRLLGEPNQHRFLFGHGMVSDDTEHTCMVAQSLCTSPTDPELFARQLAYRLRWWLLALPAGIGFATLRSILRLWVGFSPVHSGVFSAGNGPAMRSAILGTAIDDIDALVAFVRSSTYITHSDPKAFEGAFAIAFAAWCAKREIDRADAFFAHYRALDQVRPSEEFLALLARVQASLDRHESMGTFAEQIGCGQGVSGYVYRTVPVALHCWLSQPRDYEKAVSAIIRCGGDTDTTAAIVGAIVGSSVGRLGIPKEWIGGLSEFPRSVAWMEQLAVATTKATSTGESIRPPRVLPIVTLVRNAIFLAVVLGHVARRTLPPW